MGMFGQFGKKEHKHENETKNKNRYFLNKLSKNQRRDWFNTL